MSRPRLTTFVHSTETVQAAIDGGADVLILEDPAWSVRCSLHDDATPNADHIKELAEAARYSRSDIILWTIVDKLCHDQHETACRAWLTALADLGLEGVRVQDPGVAGWVADCLPQAAILMATETGNASLPCIANYASATDPAFAWQSFSNDCPVAIMRQAIEAWPQRQFECLVHGPVLLQYSDRRLAMSVEAAEADPDTHPALGRRQVTIAEKAYLLDDRQHGTLFYAGFGRCLLGALQELWTCGLHSWLIDCRASSLEHLRSALAIYSEQADRIAQDADWQVPADQRQILRQLAGHPLKPGFFLANNTDRVFDDHVQDVRDRQRLARVVDIIRPTSITLLCEAPIAHISEAALRRPDGKVFPCDLSRMRIIGAAEGDTEATPGCLIQIPWRKGIMPGTRLIDASRSELTATEKPSHT